MPGSIAFGNYISELRNKKKESDPTFSLRGFAEKLEVSTTYLLKIEKGEFPASAETIRKMAVLLGVDTDTLFALADKIDPNLGKVIIQHDDPAQMAAFLRTASGLSKDKLEMFHKMIKSVGEQDKKDVPEGDDGKK